jgi:phosphoribosylaminoimidazole-succinocarboxamide synthase
MSNPISTTSLPLPVLRHGKVRDVYEVDADRILIVATDRVSAFDVVLDQPVPNKGAVLTQLTAWWLGQIRDIPHHMISADASEIVSLLPSLAPYREALRGRAMLSRRANVFPVECVVRAYLSGSGWKDYLATGKLAGEPLPAGMLESAALPEPRFTPATKAESGHDENISRAETRARLGDVADQLEQLSLQLFRFGSRVAENAGLILADTKFEFGERDGQVILIDEVMTPDSSRFWARDSYRAGTTPPSFDKQPLRDYLQRLRNEGKWNGEAPGPRIPADVITAMTNRYLEAYKRLTGSSFSIGSAT